jgi:hypothetical protein
LQKSSAESRPDETAPDGIREAKAVDMQGHRAGSKAKVPFVPVSLAFLSLNEGALDLGFCIRLGWGVDCALSAWLTRDNAGRGGVRVALHESRHTTQIVRGRFWQVSALH